MHVLLCSNAVILHEGSVIEPTQALRRSIRAEPLSDASEPDAPLPLP